MSYKISILGDSISTYVGYNPYGYHVYYRDDRLYDNDITSVNDTWWKQVIDAIGGELCINNSYSGSCVAGTFESYFHIDERNIRTEAKYTLEDYLNTELLFNNILDQNIKVEYYDSCNSILIQIADVFANIFYSNLLNGNYEGKRACPRLSYFNLNTIVE